MQTFFSTSVSKNYVMKAKTKGPRRQVTSTYRKLSALSRAMGNSVRLDLVKGITRFKKRISLDSLYEAWSAADYGKAFATIPWDKLPEDLAPALSGIASTTKKAGDYQMIKLPPNINSRLRFDVTNPVIRNFVKNRTGELVKNIQEDAQKVIQNAVARSFTEAMTPRQVAASIKSSIGLLPQHEQAVRTYARGLQEKGLPLGNIQKYSEAYADRLLDYRAMNIARTETRMATNQGQLAVWQEGVNQGFISKDTAKKEWVVDGDPCPICEPMDGEMVGLYDPWIIEDNRGVRGVYIPTESHPQCLCGMELHFGEESKEGEES
jgi:hypothetical protein